MRVLLFCFVFLLKSESCFADRLLNFQPTSWNCSSLLGTANLRSLPSDSQIIELLFQGMGIQLPLHYRALSKGSHFFMAQAKGERIHFKGRQLKDAKILGVKLGKSNSIEPVYLLIEFYPGVDGVRQERSWVELKTNSQRNFKLSNFTLELELRLLKWKFFRAPDHVESLGLRYVNREGVAVQGDSYFDLNDLKMNLEGPKLLPVFPSVFTFKNEYLYHLMNVVLHQIKASQKTLVLGSGSGFDAAIIASQFKMRVDATDFNPMAVANTRAMSLLTHTDEYIHAWESDLFDQIPGRYDVIIFDSPVKVNLNESSLANDPNRYDREGILLRRLLRELPAHLNPGGKLYLMNRKDLKELLPLGVRHQVLRVFSQDFAVHEFSLF